MSLPQQLKTARMTNATLGSQIDDNVGALEQAVADILGAPVNTDITNAIAEIVAAGLKSLYFQDAAADPTVVGQVRRNGTALRYHDGTRVWDLQQFGITTGMMLPFPPRVLVPVPAGYLLCDGSLVSRTTYAALFAALGEVYGAGDGSTTFALPNMGGRVPAGQDTLQAEFASIGQVGGEKVHVLTEAELAAHTHGVTDPGHNHGYQTYINGGGGLSGGSGLARETFNTVASVTGISINSTGSGAGHNNLQPYLTMRWIIKF